MAEYKYYHTKIVLLPEGQSLEDVFNESWRKFFHMTFIVSLDELEKLPEIKTFSKHATVYYSHGDLSSVLDKIGDVYCKVLLLNSSVHELTRDIRCKNLYIQTLPELTDICPFVSKEEEKKEPKDKEEEPEDKEKEEEPKGKEKEEEPKGKEKEEEPKGKEKEEEPKDKEVEEKDENDEFTKQLVEKYHFFKIANPNKNALIHMPVQVQIRSETVCLNNINFDLTATSRSIYHRKEEDIFTIAGMVIYPECESMKFTSCAWMKPVNQEQSEATKDVKSLKVRSSIGKVRFEKCFGNGVQFEFSGERAVMVNMDHSIFEKCRLSFRGSSSLLHNCIFADSRLEHYAVFSSVIDFCKVFNTQVFVDQRSHVYIMACHMGDYKEDRVMVYLDGSSTCVAHHNQIEWTKEENCGFRVSFEAKLKLIYNCSNVPKLKIEIIDDGYAEHGENYCYMENETVPLDVIFIYKKSGAKRWVEFY